MIKLTDIQILKLGKTIHDIKSSNFFYGQRFPEGRITTYNGLTKLPLLTFDMLAQGYPFAYSCADTKSLISGRIQTEDKEPVMNLHTAVDLAHNAEMLARAFSIAELTEEDTLILISPQESCPQYVNTCEKLRHFLIPAGNLSHKKLFALIKDTEATCLLGDTADLTKFVETCRTTSMELTETDLRTGIFTGKPLTDGTRKHIEKESGMEVFHTPAFGDFLTGMGCDCKEHNGLHVWDDHYLAEIIDPETGKQLPDKTEGELVVTALSLTALPLIRLRTGRTASIISRDKCACGLAATKISYV